MRAAAPMDHERYGRALQRLEGALARRSSEWHAVLNEENCVVTVAKSTPPTLCCTECLYALVFGADAKANLVAYDFSTEQDDPQELFLRPPCVVDGFSALHCDEEARLFADVAGASQLSRAAASALLLTSAFGDAPRSSPASMDRTTGDAGAPPEETGGPPAGPAEEDDTKAAEAAAPDRGSRRRLREGVAEKRKALAKANAELAAGFERRKRRAASPRESIAAQTVQRAWLACRTRRHVARMRRELQELIEEAAACAIQRAYRRALRARRVRELTEENLREAMAHRLQTFWRKRLRRRRRRAARARRTLLRRRAMAVRLQRWWKMLMLERQINCMAEKERREAAAGGPHGDRPQRGRQGRDAAPRAELGRRRGAPRHAGADGEAAPCREDVRGRGGRGTSK